MLTVWHCTALHFGPLDSVSRLRPSGGADDAKSCIWAAKTHRSRELGETFEENSTHELAGLVSAYPLARQLQMFILGVT